MRQSFLGATRRDKAEPGVVIVHPHADELHVENAVM